MKFKVGDRVRCTRNILNYDTKNKIGTVKEISNLYAVDFDENVEGWSDIKLGIEEGHGVNVDKKDLELIKENTDTFTLDDLKVGYLVKLRNGMFYMVMESTNGKVLVNKDGRYSYLNKYSHNLKYTSGYTDFDIIKIYGFSMYGSDTLEFSTEFRELLWERKEILNGKEKEYLSRYIKPFKDRVTIIRKLFSQKKCKYYIQIRYKDDTPTNFPYFTNKNMYKNMETNKIYTLEELGL